MKQKLTEVKGETGNSTITFGDLNTPILVMSRTARQKINKEIKGLKNSIN